MHPHQRLLKNPSPSICQRFSTLADLSKVVCLHWPGCRNVWPLPGYCQGRHHHCNHRNISADQQLTGKLTSLAITRRMENNRQKHVTVVTHRLGRCFADTDTHFSH